MSVMNDIHNIYEFSKEIEDKNFKDFAKSLLCFCEEKKEQANINDIEVFDDLLKGQFDKDYKDILFNLVSTLKEKGFVDYQNFYDNFALHFKAQNDNEEENTLKDSICSELSANANFSELLQMQKNVENIEKNESSNEDLKDNESKNLHYTEITPSQVIAFIKDEKTLTFPFSRQQTLENKQFMKAFYKDLNSRSNQELEALLLKIRAKNEALRKELKNLKEANSKETSQNEFYQKEIVKELKMNDELKTQNEKIDINEMSLKLDKAKENLEQSRENYKKNKWFLFNKNRTKSAENKEEEIQENTSSPRRSMK